MRDYDDKLGEGYDEDELVESGGRVAEPRIDFQDPAGVFDCRSTGIEAKEESVAGGDGG